MRSDKALAEAFAWRPISARDDDAPRHIAPLDEQLRIALRKVPASVAIVATGASAAALGVTATAVTSVSLAPPTLLACVNHALRLNAAIRANGRFRIIYLSREQEEIARAFGGGAAGGERFRVGDWTLDAPGGADLPSALISFSCRLENAVDCGTHSVFIGEVEDVRTGPGVPLLYCDGLYGGLLDCQEIGKGRE